MFKIKDILDEAIDQYYNADFISQDPISIPHSFSKKQDIEISGLFAAIFSWGSRKTIINKSNELMGLFDRAPHDFILNHQDHDLKRLVHFKHRTFNTTDLLYFVAFLKHHYQNHDSLEVAFCPENENLENGLISFREYFFSLPDFPTRTRKHVASPATKSTCKRINMYLRWMVRKCDQNIDFGIWNSIKTNDLYIPLDIHVERTARKYGLLQRKQLDWKSVKELSEALRQLNPIDPIKYDFALFGLSHANNLSL